MERERGKEGVVQLNGAQSGISIKGILAGEEKKQRAVCGGGRVEVSE
jgi:hypothetical protein